MNRRSCRTKDKRQRPRNMRLSGDEDRRPRRVRTTKHRRAKKTIQNKKSSKGDIEFDASLRPQRFVGKKTDRS